MDDFCIGNDIKAIADVNERWGVRGRGWVSIETGNTNRVRFAPARWLDRAPWTVKPKC